MSDIAELDWPRLMAYIEDRMSPDEALGFERELVATPHLQREVAGLRLAWKAAAHPRRNAWNSQEMWAAVEKETGIGGRDQSRTRKPDTSRATYSRRSTASIRFGAAVIAGSLVLLALGRLGVPRHERGTTRYATAAGEMGRVRLPDGTHAVLAPGSQLTVRDRDVTLLGEAVFTVHNGVHANAPFTVRARTTTARVLGTTFTVGAYLDDPTVRIAVVDGKVGVRNIVLAAGDRIAMRGDTGQVEHSNDVTAALAWTRGALSFEETPLSEVAQRLSHWYGVKFVVSDMGVARLPLTATLLATDPVDSVMKMIAVTTGTDVRRVGNTVTIARATRVTPLPAMDSPIMLATRRLRHVR